MDLQDLLLGNLWRTAVLTVGVVYGGYKTVKMLPFLSVMPALRKLAKETRPERFEPDVVYLFHWHHDWTRAVPNLSPFSIKLETWMRLKKIKYQIIETVNQSKTTKQIPYIIFNGEEISESSNIIEFLSDYFKLDITDGLSPEQQGISRAVHRMMEDSTSWTIFLNRYVYKPDEYLDFFRMTESKSQSRKVIGIINKSFSERANRQGIGRQPRHVVENVGKSDVRAVSDILGQKQFIMGDQITLADCAVFGHLCQVAYCGSLYFHKEALGDNMVPYLDRIKERLWPDWHIRVNSQPFDS